MKAAWYERNGAAKDVLVVSDLPDPSPAAGEVRVRVHASGVNPSDVKSRAGRPLTAPKITPHSDGAGIIDQVGSGVSEKRLGERVWLWNGQWNRPFGTAAEFIALPERQAVPLPDNVSFEEGACLGIPALTALRAATTDGAILGNTVPIAGGAGAVGAYAIQFARLLGAATIIATVSSPEKGAIAQGLGADHFVDYRAEDVAERVREITGGRGVDRIIEVDAAANVGLVPRLLAREGLCVIYGSGKPDIAFPFAPMILIGAAVRFFIVYELAPEARVQTQDALSSYLRSGLLTHAVAQTFSLDEIVSAHEAVEGGRIIGNVVLGPIA